MNNENKGRDIFFGVVALATLIVAIVGATLAYFSVTASSNEGAVNATAATVSIDYYDGQQVTAQADELIPADFSVVQKVYQKRIFGSDAVDLEELIDTDNICIDDKGYQVCSIYRFKIKSDLPRNITAKLNNEENGFTYLSYAIYDVTKGTTAQNPDDAWLVLDDDGNQELSLNKCSNGNNEGTEANLEDDCFKKDENTKIKTYTETATNSIFGNTITDGKITNKSVSLTGGAEQVYDLVLFIKNGDFDQNIDQGQNYRGTIVVDVLDGGISGNGQISGYVDPE